MSHWVSRLDADRVATGHEAPYVVCQWAIHSGLSAGLKRHASMKPSAADRATITEEMAEESRSCAKGEAPWSGVRRNTSFHMFGRNLG